MTFCQVCSGPCSDKEQEEISDLPLGIGGNICAYCCVDLGWADPSILEGINPEDFWEDDEDELVD